MNIIATGSYGRYVSASNELITHRMPTKRKSHSRPLDSFDRAILRIIQEDNKTPQRLIAEAVNLSPAAVQRRVTTLEAAGVIALNVAIVDPAALSLDITALVEVNLRDERAATVDAAKALFRDTPDVQQCYYVTGGISFVLVIISRDMRSYEVLTRSLFAENDLVAGYRTLIALDRVKAGTALVVD
jgi:DNA-binding Lrp family transcriptional regulator